MEFSPEMCNLTAGQCHALPTPRRVTFAYTALLSTLQLPNWIPKIHVSNNSFGCFSCFSFRSFTYTHSPPPPRFPGTETNARSLGAGVACQRDASSFTCARTYTQTRMHTLSDQILQPKLVLFELNRYFFHQLFRLKRVVWSLNRIENVKSVLKRRKTLKNSNFLIPMIGQEQQDIEINR